MVACFRTAVLEGTSSYSDFSVPLAEKTWTMVAEKIELIKHEFQQTFYWIYFSISACFHATCYIFTQFSPTFKSWDWLLRLCDIVISLTLVNESQLI